MTELNNVEVVVTVIDDYNFSIGIDTSSYTPYLKFGEARKVIGFTSFIRDLVFENVTYKATLGYYPKSTKHGSDGSVDTVELVGIQRNAARQEIGGLLIDGISDEDLMSGRYANAEAELFNVNYEDLTMGRVVDGGRRRIGQMTLHRGTYEAELRGMTSFLQEKIGEKYSAVCRAELGDRETDTRRPAYGCLVRLDPPAWAASTAYTVRPPGDAALGSVVKSTSYTGRQFKCTTAGTSDTVEPVWALAIGATTPDGFAEWETIEALTKEGSVTAVIDRRRFADSSRDEAPMAGIGVGSATAIFPIVTLTPNSIVVVGDVVAQFPQGSKVTVTGSGGSDGTYTVQGSFSGSGQTQILIDETLPDLTALGGVIGRTAELIGFFNHGLLTFLTGENKGIAREVKNFAITQYAIAAVNTGTPSFSIVGDHAAFFAADQRIKIDSSTGNDGGFDVVSAAYDGGSDRTIITVAQAIASATADGNLLAGPGYFELFENLPFDIAVGDEYEVTAGCNLSLKQCTDKFDNVENRQAEDNTPGMDHVLLYVTSGG
jgi:hypothetical protein